MPKTKLRAVAPDEKAEPKQPRSIVEAAEAGDRLGELKAMRLIIARALPSAPPRDMAALSRRQIEIGREIEAIQVAEDEDHSVVVNADDQPWDGTGY
jgi:hypothetical protein